MPKYTPKLKLDFRKVDTYELVDEISQAICVKNVALMKLLDHFSFWYLYWMKYAKCLNIYNDLLIL